MTREHGSEPRRESCTALRRENLELMTIRKSDSADDGPAVGACVCRGGEDVSKSKNMWIILVFVADGFPEILGGVSAESSKNPQL